MKNARVGMKTGFIRLLRPRLTAWLAAFIVAAAVSTPASFAQGPKRLAPPTQIIERKKVAVQFGHVPTIEDPRTYGAKLTGTLLSRDSEKVVLAIDGYRIEYRADDVMSIEEVPVDTTAVDEQLRYARKTLESGKYDRAMALAADLLSFDFSDRANCDANQILAESVRRERNPGPTISNEPVSFWDALRTELHRWWTGQDIEELPPLVRDVAKGTSIRQLIEDVQVPKEYQRLFVDTIRTELVRRTGPRWNWTVRTRRVPAKAPILGFPSNLTNTGMPVSAACAVVRKETAGTSRSGSPENR